MSIPPPDPALIARALDVLAVGGLVAFPTETVYGLGADADNAAAVDAIFRAKGRPADHPVIVHVAGAAALPAWTSAMPPAALRLATAFWPGPLTLVVPAGARALSGVTGGQDTVGLRAPAHPWAQALLAGWTARRGDPAAALAAPSANRFGYLSPTSAAHVRDGLGERPDGVVDLILDGGACEVGIESTIVDLSAATPRILRPGAIGAEAIGALLGIPVEVVERGDSGAPAPRAPGSLDQHYAPHKPLELVAMAALAARLDALRSTRVGLLAPAVVFVDAPPHVVRRLIAAADPAAYARDLYRSLHELDASDVERILVAIPPDGPAWTAVRDRLRRAAAATG
jgi:L-threonylcarbamoyladenylate synthase